MTIERIAGVCFCVVFTSAVATGQQRSDATGQGSVTSVTEHTYAAGDGGPWQRVQTRTESGGREVVVETLELPDVDGRLAPVREAVVETIRTGGSARARRDVFVFDLDRRRQLLETTDSRQETAAAGATSTIHDTWVMDVNGRPGLTSRQIERTRSAGPDVRQTETTSLVRNLNEKLGEIERTQNTERRINAAVIQHDSTHQLRDINGRWQPVETRRGETRETGPAERVEEETIQQPDINGKLSVVERTVTRRFRAGEQDQVVIESYAPYANLWPGSDRRLVLRERVQRTTTATADGSRTVEEVEGVSLVAPSDPMRVIRRTVETVRRVGNRELTERQVFERDVNGRLRLVMESTEERIG